MIFGENTRPVLAANRLRSAVEMAAGTSSRLTEAEANRELGRLSEHGGRTVDALRQFERAEELFIGIGARRDWQDMVTKQQRLAFA